MFVVPLLTNLAEYLLLMPLLLAGGCSLDVIHDSLVVGVLFRATGICTHRPIRAVL